MSDHDPLCPGTVTKVKIARTFSSSGLTPDMVEEVRTYPCQCDLIAKVRADERATPCMDARRLRGLRANVEALEEHIVERGDLWVRRADVLGLFDGGK